jgi:hypothetical protein
MAMRRFIASGLLFAVLLAPALGFALCQPSSSASQHSGCSMCEKMNVPAHSAPVAPCCQRKAPVPVPAESSAQVERAAQVALLHAPAQTALLPAATSVSRSQTEAAPPPLFPLALLCTLRI